MGHSLARLAGSPSGLTHPVRVIFLVVSNSNRMKIGAESKVVLIQTEFSMRNLKKP
jgi:hypothetical protein